MGFPFCWTFIFPFETVFLCVRVSHLHMGDFGSQKNVLEIQELGAA